MHAFILGGSGQIVTCAQRGAPLRHLLECGARSLRVDRKEPGALRAAIGDGADAVIDVVAFDEEHAQQLLELQDVAGQFNVISSASVYRDDRGRTLDFIVGMETPARLGYTPQTSYAAYAPEVCRWIMEAVNGKDWREVFPVLKYYGEIFDYAAEDAFFAAVTSRTQ